MDKQSPLHLTEMSQQIISDLSSTSKSQHSPLMTEINDVIKYYKHKSPPSILASDSSPSQSTHKHTSDKYKKYYTDNIVSDISNGKPKHHKHPNTFDSKQSYSRIIKPIRDKPNSTIGPYVSVKNISCIPHLTTINYVGGRLHNSNEPSIINKYENGQIHYEIYYLDDKIHRRDDLPAIILYSIDGKIRLQMWFQFGTLHRIKNPAIIIKDIRVLNINIIYLIQ